MGKVTNLLAQLAREPRRPATVVTAAGLPEHFENSRVACKGALSEEMRHDILARKVDQRFRHESYVVLLCYPKPHIEIRPETVTMIKQSQVVVNAAPGHDRAPDRTLQFGLFETNIFQEIVAGNKRWEPVRITVKCSIRSEVAIDIEDESGARIV